MFHSTRASALGIVVNGTNAHNFKSTVFVHRCLVHIRPSNWFLPEQSLLLKTSLCPLRKQSCCIHVSESCGYLYSAFVNSEGLITLEPSYDVVFLSDSQVLFITMFAF